MSVNIYTPVFPRGIQPAQDPVETLKQQQTGKNMEPDRIRLNNAAIRQAVKTALQDLLPED